MARNPRFVGGTQGEVSAFFRKVWREISVLLLRDWLRPARGTTGGAAAAAAAVSAKPPRRGRGHSWRPSVSAPVPRRCTAMDLAAAAEPGAGSQRLEVRDEVAEKCQKLFLDFLEE